MTSTCFRCHHETPAYAVFCPSCGVRLSAEPSPETAASGSAAESSFAQRSALDGERKQVTVLFADLRSSLELIAGRDPEDARKVLDAVLERLIDAVRRYEGTVNQVMGDGIMALFGAPIALEDHALRACYAALRMQDALRRYAAAQPADGPAPQIRIGINSGEVVVRSISNDLHMDYTAVGQATHLASRMERLAAPGTSLVTGATARLVEPWIELQALGPRSVDGLKSSVDVYQLVRAHPVRTRFESAASGLCTFVGRALEMAALHRAGEQVADGHGQLIALVGEPGVGKSRLLWEFTRSIKRQAWRVLEAGAASHNTTAAYLPIARLVRNTLDLADDDDAARTREKMLAGLAQRGAPVEMLPALLGLLDVPVEDRAWQALDAQQRRRRIVSAVRHLLMYESLGRPLCVAIEDLHWLDLDSQAVLDELVEGLARSRVYIIVTYRPEYSHGWEGKSYYSRLLIEPLAGDTARKFVDELLGSRGSLQSLKRLLIEHTEGNPFFLEESVRHLAETGVLGGERGAHFLAGAVVSTDVPPTVHAVLAARIDRLPPARKALLQTAAVIGKDIPVALLQRVAGLGHEELRRELTELQRGEFLYELRLFPEQVYTFKHPISMEVAYRSLLRERRRVLHASIMDAIEELHAKRLAEHLERLSHHALQGQVWDKALKYGREAGLRALERSAARAAVAFFEQALGALNQLPADQIAAQAIDLRLDLRAALSPLGEFASMIRYLEEAETLASRLPDPRRLGLVCSFLANFFTMQGQTDRALAYGRRALEISAALTDPTLAVLANASIATTRMALGDYRGGVEVASCNLALLTGAAEYDRFGMGPLPSVYSRVILALSHAELGEFAEALAHAERALQIAEAIDHPHSVTLACQALGTVRLRLGEAGAAIELLERGLAMCETADIRAALPQIAGALSSAYTLEGRAVEALQLLERAVRLAAATNNAFGHLLRSGYRAEASLALGRSAEALPLAQRYLEMTRFIKARGLEGWASRLYGAVAATLEPPVQEQARPAYERGLAIAQELGMRPLEAHCRLGIGVLTRRSRGGDYSRAHLQAARAAFFELGMARWVEATDEGLSPARPASKNERASRISPREETP